MKKNILKIFVIISLVMLISTFAISAKAVSTSLDPDYQVKTTVKNFLTNLESGSYSTLNYIDSHNSELYSTAQDRLYTYDDIKYEIKKVNHKGDTYEVEAKISAEGTNWSISGLTAKFDVQYVNGSYRITDTDFFKITSPEHIAGMAVGIVGIVFLIIGIVFFGIIIVIIIVVVIVVKKNKKK